MTVVNVEEMWSQRGGGVTNPSKDGLDLKYSFTRAFTVLTTHGTLEDEVLSSTDLPANGEQHDTGVAAFVNSRVPTQLSPILWQVVVGYDGESPDPESVDVEWTDASASEPIDRDYNGVAILTANGEQIEGLTVELADQVAVVTKKFLTINTYAMSAYRHAVNSDTFLGWPPGTCRLVGISAKNRFKYNQAQEQWTATFRFQFRAGLMGATDAQAWYKRWRHEGMYVNDGSGNIYRARDMNGLETSRPVLLKTDGTQETDPTLAVFKYTQVYGSLPYSGLGIL